jgi:hypothetical protein
MITLWGLVVVWEKFPEISGKFFHLLLHFHIVHTSSHSWTKMPEYDCYTGFMFLHEKHKDNHAMRQKQTWAGQSAQPAILA